MTGDIAQAYYGNVPEYIITETRRRLSKELLKIVDEFGKKYPQVESRPQ
jgi:ADP-ribosylglycohydrolase